MKRIHPKWFLCATLALVGAFLFFCLPGYKFAGLALMGLSALIPVYHFLRHDFLRRVLTALLALGFVVLSITGGKGDKVNLSEAQCMFNYLTAAGIDAARITMEDRATTTVENLQNVRSMLDTNEVDILSSNFHLYRAGLIAKDAGFVPTLIPAETKPLSLLAKWFLREIFVLYPQLFR